jgi:hypothetical protein
MQGNGKWTFRSPIDAGVVSNTCWHLTLGRGKSSTRALIVVILHASVGDALRLVGHKEADKKINVSIARLLEGRKKRGCPLNEGLYTYLQLVRACEGPWCFRVRGAAPSTGQRKLIRGYVIQGTDIFLNFQSLCSPPGTGRCTSE